MSEQSEGSYDLAIEHTFPVNGVSSDGSFELRAGNDGDVYVICERSARVYALTMAEANAFANDILRLVEQMRSAGSAP